MNKYICVLLLAMIGAGGQKAVAQFNDTTFYHTGYISSGSINKTKDGTAYLLNNGLKFNVKRKDISLNFNNSWVYGRQQGNLTNNDFSTTLDFNLYKTFKRFNYWGLANYNTSYSLKINNQLLTGVGIAYSFVDTKTAYLNISDGILYDKSDLFLNDTTREVYHTFRNSARLSFRFVITENLIVESSSFLQNSFDRGSDYIIRSNSSLSYKLNKWLSLTTVLAYNRQNRTQSENLLFTYGFTFDRFF